jgi:hypothetical protein
LPQGALSLAWYWAELARSSSLVEEDFLSGAERQCDAEEEECESCQ